MTEEEIDIQITKALAEIERLRAESSKIYLETRFYPWIISVSAIMALGTLATIANKIL